MVLFIGDPEPNDLCDGDEEMETSLKQLHEKRGALVVALEGRKAFLQAAHRTRMREQNEAAKANATSPSSRAKASI